MITLAGCSIAGSNGSKTGDGTTAGSNAQTADRTYSAADLSAILNAVKKATGSTGQVISDAKLKQSSASSGGISSLLTNKGLTIQPASCAKLITSKLPSAANGYGLGSDAIGAALVSTTGTTISLSSVAEKQLPDSAKAALTSGLDSLLGECSSLTMKMKVAGNSISVGLKIKKIDVKTDGDQSIGIQETIELPAVAGTKGKPYVLTIIEARKGNLLAAAIDPLGGSTTDDLVTSVNGALAQAAKLK